MWRPEDKVWFKIKRARCKVISGSKADCEHCPAKPQWCNISFEAGADAMLEALKKGGSYTPARGGSLDRHWIEIDANGWLVFIPEEEE